MFNFPSLKSLCEKNGHYKSMFPKMIRWEREAGGLDGGKCDNELKNCIEYGGEEKVEANGRFALHWKKAVKLKFEVETDSNRSNLEDRDMNIEDESVSLKWLENLGIASILRKKSTADGSVVTGGDLQCVICEDVFESKQLLNQHKRLEHFPSWEGRNKEFCYVPYFVEPKRFNLLRGTLAKEQSECTLCQRWLSGGVKEKVGSYLEDLRMKIKEKAGDDNEALCGNDSKCAPINNKRRAGKGRGRKCKSMVRRVCELCSKILSNRKGLERHMLIHTGEKPFPCDICGKPFRRKDNCVRHKKTAHLFKKPRKPRRRKTLVDDANSC